MKGLRSIEQEFILVSVALNGQGTITCYALDRTLDHHKVLSAISQEVQLSNRSWLDNGRTEKMRTIFKKARVDLELGNFSWQSTALPTELL